MVIIVKRLVPVYKADENVPKKFRNLRKAVHVASFKNLYPNIPDILVKQYGLTLDEKIVVFWTKCRPMPHFQSYRLPFKKVFSGPLSALGEHMENVRRSKRKQETTKNE